MIFITSAAKPVTAAASDAAAAHSLYLCWVIVWDFNMWRQKCHWERDVGKQKDKEGLDRRTRSHTGRNMNWLRTCEEDWRVIWQILWRSEARKVKWLSDETVWQGYRVCGDLTTNDLIPWMTTAWVDCSSLGCRVKNFTTEEMIWITEVNVDPGLTLTNTSLHLNHWGCCDSTTGHRWFNQWTKMLQLSLLGHWRQYSFVTELWGWRDEVKGLSRQITMNWTGTMKSVPMVRQQSVVDNDTSLLKGILL